MLNVPGNTILALYTGDTREKKEVNGTARLVNQFFCRVLPQPPNVLEVTEDKNKVLLWFYSRFCYVLFFSCCVDRTKGQAIPDFFAQTKHRWWEPLRKVFQFFFVESSERKNNSQEIPTLQSRSPSCRWSKSVVDENDVECRMNSVSARFQLMTGLEDDFFCGDQSVFNPLQLATTRNLY